MSKRIVVSFIGLDQYLDIVRDVVRSCMDKGELREYTFPGFSPGLDDFLELVFLHLCEEAIDADEFFCLTLQGGSYCFGRRFVCEEYTGEVQNESDATLKSQVLEKTKERWDAVIARSLFCCVTRRSTMPEMSVKATQVLLDMFCSLKKGRESN